MATSDSATRASHLCMRVFIAPPLRCGCRDEAIRPESAPRAAAALEGMKGPSEGGHLGRTRAERGAAADPGAALAQVVAGPDPTVHRTPNSSASRASAAASMNENRIAAAYGRASC